MVEHPAGTGNWTMSVDVVLNTSSTESDGSCDYKDFYDRAKVATGLYIYPTLCLFGLTGNTIIIIVLWRSRPKTSTNIYLIALALSDATKLLNDLLYFLVTLIEKYKPEIGKEAFYYLYPYAHFVFNSTACLTAWYTVSVAVERYIFVCHPTASKTICTIRRAKVTCLIIFFIMSILAIPSALRYNVVHVIDNVTLTPTVDLQVTTLWKNDGFARSYTWIQNLLRGIVPLVTLIVLNSRIIHSLRKTRANKKMKYRNRITLMLIGVVIVFLVCISPDAVLSTFFGYGYAEESYLVKGIREISDTLLAVNSAVNIILYSIFNKLFRLHFMKLFCHGSCLNDESQQELLSFDKVSSSMRILKSNAIPSLNIPKRHTERYTYLPNITLLRNGSACDNRGRFSTGVTIM